MITGAGKPPEMSISAQSAATNPGAVGASPGSASAGSPMPLGDSFEQIVGSLRKGATTPLDDRRAMSMSGRLTEQQDDEPGAIAAPTPQSSQGPNERGSTRSVRTSGTAGAAETVLDRAGFADRSAFGSERLLGNGPLFADSNERIGSRQAGEVEGAARRRPDQNSDTRSERATESEPSRGSAGEVGSEARVSNQAGSVSGSSAGNTGTVVAAESTFSSSALLGAEGQVPVMMSTLESLPVTLPQSIRVALHSLGRQAVIRMRPPELGSIRIHLRLDGSGLSARIEAERADVATLLRGMQGRLETALRNSGLSLERLEIEVGNAALGRSRIDDGPMSASESDRTDPGDGSDSSTGAAHRDAGSGGETQAGGSDWVTERWPASPDGSSILDPAVGSGILIPGGTPGFGYSHVDIRV